MALTEEKLRAYSRRLLVCRMRLLCDHGFYGLLLMHMKYSVDEQMETAATDGTRIIFGADFLDSLTDRELEFVMMHEILHVVLQHCFRGQERDPELFNIACDIVVNSHILQENGMDPDSITLKQYGVLMHQTPDGEEGYERTAEEVYEALLARGGRNGNGNASQSGAGQKSGGGQAKQGRTRKSGGVQGRWDDHSQWNDGKDKADGVGKAGGAADGDDVDAARELWAKRLMDACEAIAIRDPSNERGLVPAFALRMVQEWKQPQTDWRTILNEFVQEEVVDYSFTPPDRRFGDSPFFLPDFNEKEDRAEDILFMIDTSGSMSDDMVTTAYSEVKGAIDQFDGKLKGWLGFFDAVVVPPKPFESEEEFRVIRPEGGGGTSFDIIFEYVFRHMADQLPVSIIILTDGYAPFPAESHAHGIPVLWLMNNEEVQPPWGKVARITVEDTGALPAF